MRRPRQTLAAALLLPLLVGCGGAPQASDPPSIGTASPSNSSSSEPIATPQAPESATRTGPAGATAFVTYWVEVLNFAGATGDTTLLEQLSTADCVRCRALVDGISAIYEQGGRIEGGGWEVASTKPYGVREQRFFIDAVIDSEPQSVIDADGTTEEFEGAQDRLRAFVLKRVGGGWRVAELDPTA